MVSTDGRTDRRTDTEGYNIIPRHTLVAGYKNSMSITYQYKIYQVSRKYRDLNLNVCFGAQINCHIETVLFEYPKFTL